MQASKKAIPIHKSLRSDRLPAEVSMDGIVRAISHKTDSAPRLKILLPGSWN